MNSFVIHQNNPGLVTIANPFPKTIDNSNSNKENVTIKDKKYHMGKIVKRLKKSKPENAQILENTGIIHPPPNSITKILLSELSKQDKNDGNKHITQKGHQQIIAKFPPKSSEIGQNFATLIKNQGWNNAILKLAQFTIINEALNEYIYHENNVTFGDLITNENNAILKRAFIAYNDFSFVVNDYSVTLAKIILDSKCELVNSPANTLTVARSFSDLRFIPESLCASSIVSACSDFDLKGRYRNGEQCYIKSNNLKVFTRQAIREEWFSREYFTHDLNDTSFKIELSEVENLAITIDSLIYHHSGDSFGELIHAVGRICKEYRLKWISKMCLLLFVITVEIESRNKGFQINESTIRTIAQTFADIGYRTTFADVNNVETIAKNYAKSNGSIPLSFILRAGKN